VSITGLLSADRGPELAYDPQQAGDPTALELDEEVDVAPRVEVVAEGGAEDRQPPDAVPAAELLDRTSIERDRWFRPP
jgi:hypothetical protein